MMYSIDILGSFDFLEQEIRIGTLEYERLKGSPSYRFTYDQGFLNRFRGISLSADIGNFLGVQAASKSIFSMLGDALPDRWGKALIDKRERLEAETAQRVPRVFDDFGYLVRIDDFSRMGALRFKYQGRYLGKEEGDMAVPPITSLDGFIREAQEIELAEKQGREYKKEWIDNVWKPGSSLGGARPKMNVTDKDGNLWIAKIPSVNDTYDVGLWEYFACSLARKAGISVADCRLLKVGPTPYHTLLSKRFDRKGDRRIHFASALTLTGLHDGDNADNGKGYIDIVDAIAGSIGVVSLKDSVVELFKRIAFSIIIGNHDDHFRNHGFLLHENGWKLSPAYDLNPSQEMTQSLLISEVSNRSSLEVLLDASEYYLITPDIAKTIIQEVVVVTKQWKQHARNIGIPTKEQQRFERRIEYSLDEARKLFPDEVC